LERQLDQGGVCPRIVGADGCLAFVRGGEARQIKDPVLYDLGAGKVGDGNQAKLFRMFFFAAIVHGERTGPAQSRGDAEPELYFEIILCRVCERRKVSRPVSKR
jgi:hypothetical protein